MRLTAGRRACRKPDKCWRPGQRTAAVIAALPMSAVFVSFFLALKYTLELSDCSVGRRQVDSDISHFTSLRHFVELQSLGSKRCRLQDRSRRIWQEDNDFNSRKTRSVGEHRPPSRQIWSGSGLRLWMTSKFNGDFLVQGYICEFNKFFLVHRYICGNFFHENPFSSFFTLSC